MATSISQNLTFEETLPYFGIKGGAAVALSEGADQNDFFPKASPVNIIQTDQMWYVKFRWETYGLLNHLMCGTFRLNLYLEEMGKGEFGLDPAYSTANVSFKSKPHAYEHTMVIPAGQVPAGVYKLVASLTFTGPEGVPGPIAAFAEIGAMQIYAEGPTNP